jgi:hypothetical protein
MFGAYSNRRRGILNTSPVTERLRLGQTTHRIFYEQACLVRSVDGNPMAVPGDSGSVLLDEDQFAIAMVVGMIRDGDNCGWALATPLSPAVDALDIELISSQMAVCTDRRSAFDVD